MPSNAVGWTYPASYQCLAAGEALDDKAWCQLRFLLLIECPVEPSCLMEIDICMGDPSPECSENVNYSLN